MSILTLKPRPLSPREIKRALINITQNALEAGGPLSIDGWRVSPLGTTTLIVETTQRDHTDYFQITITHRKTY